MITELKNPEFGRRSDETGGQTRNLEDRLFDITKSGTKKKMKKSEDSLRDFSTPSSRLIHMLQKRQKQAENLFKGNE